MAVRETQGELIGEIRRMIGDKASPQVFDDDDISAALDARRDDVRQMQLTPASTIAPGGATIYLDYFAPYGAWEDGETLQDGGFNTIVADSAERVNGVWHFASHRKLPVFLTGRVYDLPAVAADLLEMKLQSVSSGFDFSVDGLSVNRGSQAAALQQSIARMRACQRVKTVRMIRGDE